MKPLVVVALVYVVASRLWELWYSRRTERAVLDLGGRRVVPDGLVPLLVVHVGWILALAVEAWLDEGRGSAAVPHAARIGAGVVFVAAEALRFACIRALGSRWNVRVLVLPGEPGVARGPYRFLRHPNYIAAAVGLVSLPLALGLPWTAAAVLPCKWLALRRRIRIEDAALAQAERE